MLIAQEETGERIEAIELPLLLDAVVQRYGYDFRGYAPTSLKRRLRRALQEERLASFSALQERLLRDVESMARLLDAVSVEVTVMFRDPGFYRTFRDAILPTLRTQPLIRIWHAGCATGEEVYSMAILLHEEGLLDKARLYATDLNARALERGRAAIFPIRQMQENTANYQKAGGRAAFSDYYTAQGDSVILRQFLRRNIVWAEHNLVSDGSFNQFDVILCRNVLIYFGPALQTRVLRLLDESLCLGGCLGLGLGESLQPSVLAPHYEMLDRVQKWYRKRSAAP